MRLGGRPGLRRALSQPARPALLGFARALQRETSAVCSWRLKSRNRERKFERPHQEARRPLLRAQAPAPPPGAPRAHSDRGLKTTQEKNGPKFFPCKRYPHSRARFAVGCAATLLPTQIGNAPPAYSLVLTPGRPHAAFCLTCYQLCARKGFARIAQGKMANYAQVRRTPAACYFSGAAGAPQGDTAECRLSGTPKHPDRSPARDSAAARRGLVERRGTRGAASHRAGPGRSGLFLEDVRT